MSAWYYVEDGDRKGPIDEKKLSKLVKDKTLGKESYIWTKGFDNWERFSDVDQVSHLLEPKAPATPILPTQENKVNIADPQIESELHEIPTMDESNQSINWSAISRTERIFMVKIGADRGIQEAEYGPYGLEQLKLAFDQNRINCKTYFYTQGMASWSFLADMPIYEEIFLEAAPKIDEVNRRENVRKPFVARMLFHDNKKVYEGICRDISEGGMQVLVSNCPINLGEEVSMNVHPDNGEYNFVAKGKIVRLLDGNQGFSLRFKSLEQDARSSINHYFRDN